jgi:hypothetical protein
VYKDKFGHVDVPQQYNDDVAHPKLGTWVHSQRQRFEKYKRSAPERIDKLNSIGFNWKCGPQRINLSDEDAWDSAFARLLVYKDKF